MSEWQQQVAPRLGGMPSADWIAGRITTLLSHYYQPEQSPEVAEAAMMDWISVLSVVPRQAISAACDAYLKTEPTRRPTPGAIREKAHAWMRVKGFSQPARIGIEPPREKVEPRVTPEAAQEILGAAGFTPKRFGDMRRARMATTFAAAEAQVDKPRAPHWTETVDPDSPEMEALRRARDENPLIAKARAAAAARKADEGAA